MSKWFGIAQPEPGRSAELAAEIRNNANDMRRDLSHVNGTAEVADSLDRLADDIEGIK